MLRMERDHVGRAGAGQGADHGAINKNTEKNTGFGDWRCGKISSWCLMVGLAIGEPAKPGLGKALWAQSESGRAGDLGFP